MLVQDPPRPASFNPAGAISPHQPPTVPDPPPAGTEMDRLNAIAGDMPLASYSPPVPGDPLAPGCFVHIRAVADPTVRLALIHEAASTVDQARRAEAISLAVSAQRLFSATGGDPVLLAHYFGRNGALRFMAPMDPAVREHPRDRAHFDAAVEEVRALYAAIGGTRTVDGMSERVRGMHRNRFALLQLARMSAEQRRAIASQNGGYRLAELLGIHRSDRATFRWGMDRCCRAGVQYLINIGAATSIDEDALPDDMRALWNHVAHTLATAAEPLPRAQAVPRARRKTHSAPAISRPERRRQLELRNDFILACLRFSTADLAACVDHLGRRKLAARLGLGSERAVRELLDPNGQWRPKTRRRVAKLMRDQRQNRVPQSGRVAEMRAVLAAMLLAARAVKPDPGLELQPVQRRCVRIRADRPDGGDWLAGLDLASARIAEDSWARFAREALVPAGLAPRSRNSLRARLDTDIPALLQDPEPAASLERRFEYVTTLDDGHERGRGVHTRVPLSAFEPLFVYGGTVCATEAEADLYRDRFPDAWKYALAVGPIEGTSGDATCFGYPEGNIGTAINARLIRGSARQLRRAANVAILLVAVPGLPFGLPMMLTLRALASGEELFLDYGIAFARYVLQSLGGHPRWPTVKIEPGLRPPSTLEHFLEAYRALPEGGDVPPDPLPSARPPRDWTAALADAGYILRRVPADGDGWLHALEGHVLDAVQMQQLRHDLSDVIARWPDTAESDRMNAREAARAIQRRHPRLFESGGLWRGRVPHAVYADLQRVPGMCGGDACLRAWCELIDDRARSRRADRRSRPPRPTRVAVLGDDATLEVWTADGCVTVDLGTVDGCRVVTQALSDVDVALLRQGEVHLEILQGGTAVASG